MELSDYQKLMLWVNGRLSEVAPQYSSITKVGFEEYKKMAYSPAPRDTWKYLKDYCPDFVDMSQEKKIDLIEQIYKITRSKSED